METPAEFFASYSNQRLRFMERNQDLSEFAMKLLTHLADVCQEHDVDPEEVEVTDVWISDDGKLTLRSRL